MKTPRFSYPNKLVLAIVALLALTHSWRGYGAEAQPVQSTPNNGTSHNVRPTTLPWQFINANGNSARIDSTAQKGSDGTSRQASAMVFNPDPNGTGIVYSQYADNPDAGVSVRNLAANLANDPIKIYEWVRNNVRTEFYFGGSRGAELTLIERAGNDIDQCALLGALLKAAGYTPTYTLDWLWIPRTASAPNQNRVGVYEWLGVDNDQSARDILSNYAPAQFDGDGLLRIAYMWVNIILPGRSESVYFVPSLKPHSFGRRPNLDTLTGYNLGDAQNAAGGSPGAYSPAISSTGLRTYLTARVTAASTRIHSAVTAPDLDLSDLSGAELAWHPAIVREVVSATTPNATRYPQGVLFNYQPYTQPLSGIPVTYLHHMKMRVGNFTRWFECPELLGRPLAIEFDGSGIAHVKFDGTEIAQENSGHSSDYVQVELRFEYATAFYGGESKTHGYTNSVPRRNAVVYVYGFGRSVGRLQNLLKNTAEMESVYAPDVTATDRLQIIGLQYLSQADEMVRAALSSIDYQNQRFFHGGFVTSANNPGLDIGINVGDAKARSASASSREAALYVHDMISGALEGTALEQMTEQRGFGATTVLDYANRGAYLLDASNYATYSGSLANFNDATLGCGALSKIQGDLSNGWKVLVLADSNIVYTPTSTSLGAWLEIVPEGGVGSILKGAMGGTATTTTPGIFSTIGRWVSSAVNWTATVITHVLTTSRDPVDLTTGAFLKFDTDLVVGDAEPMGLRLDRTYNSALRISDPVGLGRGWTHNYDMRMAMRSPNEFDINRAGVDEVLPVLVAAHLIQDAVTSESSARSWLMVATAATWAVDQQINSRASVTLGSRSLEFVKQPDGNFVAEGNLTATLARQSGDGSWDLAFRHGNTIHFRGSDGKFTNIQDQALNTLTASYDGSRRLTTVTDAYNRTFTFSYDGSGRLTQVTDSTGRAVHYGRDASGNFTFTDAENKTQTLEWNSDYLITRIRDGRGRIVVENDYDWWKRVSEQRALGESNRTTLIGIAPGVGLEQDPAGGRVWSYFDERGRKIFTVDQVNNLTSWKFDGVDRLIETTTPKGEKTSYGYDAYHVLTREIDPENNTRTIVPDAEHRPWKVRNFEEKETVFTYTAQHQVETITAPGAIVSSFQYDSRGRLWKAHPAAYATNEFDVYQYNSTGGLDAITRPGGGEDLYSYNDRGDCTEMIDRSDVKTSFEYNARRQRTKVIHWVGSTQLVTQTYYDDAGDVDYVIDASGRKTDMEHDALGHLTETKQGPIGAQVVTLSNDYSDSRGLLHSVTDGENNVSTFSYYGTERLATKQDPLNRITTFGYDENQRQVTVMTPLGLAANPQYKTTTVWDSRGLVAGVEDPEHTPAVVVYHHDKDGRMTGLTNRRDKFFEWTYDDANLTVTATTPTGKATIAIGNTRGLPASVEEPSTQTTYLDSYDLEGRLTQKRDGVGTTTYTYWPNGLPKEVNETSGGVTHTTYREYDTVNRLKLYRHTEGTGSPLNYEIGYTYYPSGELHTITYPGTPAKTVTYDYDDFGRLWHVRDWSARVTTYTYDNASRLKRIDRPNGTYRTQDYDAASQLTFAKEFKANGTLLSFEELRYDADGRITYQFFHPKPADVTLPEDNLAYDDDNRLSTWNNDSVTFDADGNMTYGPLPSGTFGNYGYDSRNRLTSAGGSGYRYNPDGLRVEVTNTGAAVFVIDPNAALSRTLMRTKGEVTTYYVYGLGLLYEVDSTSDATKTYHSDHIGNTVALTNDSQTVTDRWSYAPFGAVTRITGSTDTPFQFNGEFGVQTDANGLCHMRARYYNPRLMRFCNADPIGFDGGVNWYAFGENSPISNIDPSGKAIAPVHFTVTLITELLHGHLFSAPIVAFQSAWTDFRMINVGGGRLEMSTMSNNALATNIHSMGGFDSNLNGPQTEDEAYAGATTILNKNLQAGNDPDNSYIDRTLFLGDAYHNVEDNRTGPHVGYPDFSHGFGGFPKAVVHILGDTLISPVTFVRMIIAAYGVRNGTAKLDPPNHENTQQGDHGRS